MLDLDKCIISESDFNVTDLHKHLTNGNIFITKQSLQNDIQICSTDLLNDVIIHCSGENNKIIIEEGSKLISCGIYINGNNNLIKIGKNCKLKGAYLMCIDDFNKITLGNEVSVAGEFWGYVHFHTMEGSSIYLGNDCMLSGNITLRTTDGHAIIDKNGKRVNLPKDIVLGNHIWCGMNTTILKGAEIPNNSIIGANSVITKKFEKSNNKTNYIAGNPAKIVKCNETYWLRARGHDFSYSDFKLIDELEK